MSKINKFNYKVYSLSWTYKFTINEKDIKSDVRFTANNTWWQWQYQLLLNYSFENSNIVNTDIIKVYRDTVLIYTWIVQDVVRTITNNYEQITLPLLWLWTLPTYILYKDWWSYTFTKTQDPAQTVRDIIDYINTVYTAWWLSYDWSSIVNYWTNVSIDFENDSCFDALKKCLETTNFTLFIDRDWKVYFKWKPVSATHTLTVAKDVEQINLEEDSERLTNKLILKHKTTTTPYEDVTSQTTYWLREIFINDQSLANQAAADEFWNNYIAENKDPLSKTNIIINNNFDIDTIKVWDTIEVKNFNFTISNLLIVKYTYNTNKITIFLEDFDSFWRELNI